MFNNYFDNYTGFVSITKENLPPKFTMPDIKFQGTENPHHHVRNIVGAMILKGIDKDIFYITFP